MSLDAFWAAIDAAKTLLADAKGADDVFALCSTDPDVSDGAASGWWGGDGDELMGVLLSAGWRIVEAKAAYYWCMAAPDGTLLSYVEGDLYRGNTLLRGGD